MTLFVRKSLAHLQKCYIFLSFPGCSYKVFYAMPCVQETLEQELHLILTGGGSGCHFFKRLAKDCQMPVNKAEVGVVVLPESSKFATLLRDHTKRDKADIELYLGVLKLTCTFHFDVMWQ